MVWRNSSSILYLQICLIIHLLVPISPRKEDAISKVSETLVLRNAEKSRNSQKKVFIFVPLDLYERLRCVKKTALTILTLTLIVFPLIMLMFNTVVHGQNLSNIGVMIKRDVWARSGYMVVIDELRFNTTVNDVSFYLPYDIYKSIYNFKISLSNTTITPEITVEPFVNSSLKITIHTAVQANTPLKLQYSFVEGSYAYKLSSRPDLTIVIPRTLGLDYTITSFNATIHYETSWISNVGSPVPYPSIPSFTFSVSTNEIYARYSFSQVKPIDLTAEQIVANVTNPTWFRALSLIRTITISPSGSITIEDNYYVKYLGYTKISNWAPSLQGLTITSFGDELGDFTFDTATNKWTLRYALNNSDKAYFIIRSKPSNLTLWSTTENGITKLKIDLFQGLIAPVDNFTAIIVFPPGSSDITLEPLPTDYQSSNALTYIYRAFNVTPYDTMTVSGTVRLASYMSYINTLNIILMIGISGGAFIALYLWASLKTRPPEEIAKVPISNISNLTELYIKRLSLTQELDKLDEDYKLKKIKKSIYVQRSHAVKSELATIEGQIKILTSKIKDTRSKANDLIKELESHFATLTTIKVSINELERQLSTGKISRETYTRLYNNYMRDRQRILNRIDNLLRQLEEISKSS